MRFRIDYILDGVSNYIVVEGVNHEDCLEKAFTYLEEIEVYDAKISEVK